jgi:hypothetical protein
MRCGGRQQWCAELWLLLLLLLLLLSALLWECCVEHQAVECAGNGPACPQAEGLLALVQVCVV